MENNSLKRIDYIDSLRGIAASMVVFTHTILLLGIDFPVWFARLVGEGARGVQLFFIISAFTLFLSLDKTGYAGEKHKTIFYILRRIFRIAPLFYCMICVSLTLQIVFPKVASLLNLDPSLITLLTSLSFTGAFFPGYFDNLVPTQWTIGVEMLFYVFVPILFLKIKSSRQTLVGYVVTSSTSLLSIILIIALGGDDKLAWVNHLYPHIYKSILFQLPIFFLGILYFYFLKENKSYKTLLPVLWISLAQTIIFGLFQMLTLGKFDLSIISPRIQLTAVIFLFMIVGIQKTNILNGNKFLTFLGTISYSVYLLHYMILSCTAYTLTNMTWFRTLSAYSQFWILFILAYSIIILISSLTFKYIETPGQKIGSNLYKKLFP